MICLGLISTLVYNLVYFVIYTKKINIIEVGLIGTTNVYSLYHINVIKALYV